MTGFFPRGRKLLCAAAVFCVLSASHAACSALSGRRPGAEVKGFAFQGGAFSARSAGLRLDFSGAGAAARPPGIEAAGLELRVRTGEWDVASFLSGLIGGALYEIPPVALKNCVVFFEGAPPGQRPREVFFKALRVSPEAGYLRVEAEDVDFGRFQICRIEADVGQSGDLLEIHRITGVFAGGEVEGEGGLNLASMDASASAVLKGVLLKELNPVFPADFSGEAELSFDLSGNLFSRSVSGSGAARLSGGEITGVPVLYGLAPAFLRPAYDDAVFSGGEAHFRLDRGAIRIERARLESDDVSLQGGGTLGIDGKVDIIVDASFTEGYMRGRTAPAEVLGHVLRACDFLMIRHRISGTLSEPSYELIPLPVFTSLPLGIKRVLGFLLPMRAGVQP